MKTSIRHLVTRPHAVNSAYAVNGIEPVKIWDFDAGLIPSDFAINRAVSALGYDAAGRFVSYMANSLRIDARPPLRTALLEPAATNLLSRAIANTSTGWSLNGADTSTLALNALGLFPGVLVTSKGAIWHRLTHIDEPSVANGASYHLRVFFKFGTSGKIMVTLRSNVNSAESRFIVSTTTTNILAGAFSNITLIPLGVDGVYRLDANYVSNFVGPLSVGLGPGSATTGENVTLLAAQFETGTAGSSFINTTGAAATRAADTVTWAAPVGTYDLRIVDGSGAESHHPTLQIGVGWKPQAAPFFPARVLLYPQGAL